MNEFANIKVYLPGGVEFPVESGGELRTVTKYDAASVELSVRVAFEFVDAAPEKSQLLRIHQWVTDEQGRVWKGAGLIGLYPLIRAVDSFVPHDAKLKANEGQGGGAVALVENVRFFEDGREDLYFSVHRPELQVHGARVPELSVVYRARMKYYSAAVDLHRITSKLGDRICLRLTPHVDSEGYLRHGDAVPERLPDITSLAPLNALLQFGSYLLRDWSELYHEDELVFDRPKFVPTPIVLSATGEMGEPTPGFKHEP